MTTVTDWIVAAIELDKRAQKAAKTVRGKWRLEAALTSTSAVREGRLMCAHLGTRESIIKRRLATGSGKFTLLGLTVARMVCAA